ncbi:MAG: MATE family efflux transporter [Pseudomonadota bacterium]
MAGSGPKPATWRRALAIAWPASLAAIITPLLGLIDIAVLGRGADAIALAGASLGGAVISILYWSFGFLRMSLSGLSAQALGRGDDVQLRAYLLQGLSIGLAIGTALALLAEPIRAAGHVFLVETSEASSEAGAAMGTYLRIRLLAAPAVLATTAILGWLTGQAKTVLLMAITASIAVINAVLSVVFVLELNQGIAGLAAATALSEVAGLVLGGLAVLWVTHRRGGVRQHWDISRARRGLGAMMSLNRDIFLRTLLIDLVLLSFARIGAGFGDLTVAANHVLLNLVFTVTLLLDGPAIAAETYVGQALGAKTDKPRFFRAAWRETAKISAVQAMVLSLAMAVFGSALLGIIVGEGPDSGVVVAEAHRYLPWAMLMPLAVAAAYHLDGVYIGATRGAALRNTMALSALMFTATALVLVPLLDNHGLWLALLVFMLARGLFLMMGWKAFRAMVASERDAAPPSSAAEDLPK